MFSLKAAQKVDDWHESSSAHFLAGTALKIHYIEIRSIK